MILSSISMILHLHLKDIFIGFLKKIIPFKIIPFKTHKYLTYYLKSIESNRDSLFKSLSKALYKSVGVFKGVVSFPLCSLYIFSSKFGNLTRMKASTFNGSNPSLCEILNNKLLKHSWTKSEKETLPKICPRQFKYWLKLDKSEVGWNKASKTNIGWMAWTKLGISLAETKNKINFTEK